jgi:hypothetical protein
MVKITNQNMGFESLCSGQDVNILEASGSNNIYITDQKVESRMLGLEEAAMVNLQYHRGQHCIYSRVFCQEGYCSDCEICRIWNLNKIEELSLNKREAFGSKIAVPVVN